MADKIRVVNSFKYRNADLHPELDLGEEINAGYNKDMRALVAIAKMLNGDRSNLSISFWGDTDKGLRFSIDGDNQQIREQVSNAFDKWLKDDDNLY